MTEMTDIDRVRMTDPALRALRDMAYIYNGGRGMTRPQARAAVIAAIDALAEEAWKEGCAAGRQALVARSAPEEDRRDG